MRALLSKRLAPALSLGLAGFAAIALWAAPANAAVKIAPEDKAFVGNSSLVAFQYAGVTITCKSEIGGRTTKPASAYADVTSITFKECKSSTEYTTTVIASASGANPFKLVATKANGDGSGQGYLEIPAGGTVTVKVFWGIFTACVFTAKGAQTVPATIDPWKASVNLYGTVTVERTGGLGTEEQCGPGKSTAIFSADYNPMYPDLEVIDS